ncbi:MAG: V-type ATP synthase subunit F [Methanomicrobiales archaeon]|nr:V-type ATP synthase subunit F [Methanomicrobiales archaeon]
MKIAVIGEESVVRGFALAGVREGTVVSDPDGAEGAFERYQEDPSIGVIIVHDRIGLRIEERLEKARRERKAFPMIVVCPGPEGRLPYEDAFTRSVRILSGFGKSQLGGVHESKR